MNTIMIGNRERTRRMKKVGVICLALIFCCMTLIGCSESGAKGEIYADFTVGLSDKFTASNWSSIGGAFDCRWNKSNVAYNESKKVVELK